MRADACGRGIGPLFSCGTPGGVLSYRLCGRSTPRIMSCKICFMPGFLCMRGLARHARVSVGRDTVLYHAPMSESSEYTYRDYAAWARLSLEEIAADCEVQVFRASGPGGQCVNTTDSAVRTTHVPSGITVVSRESRSQFRNRQLCLQKLRDEFAARAVPPKVRRKTKVPRRSRERRLADKHQRSQLKASRRGVGSEE